MSAKDNAFRAFEATLQHLRATHAVVVLRPRDICIHDAFDGDYDLLFDPDRLPHILTVALTQCRKYDASLIVEQSAPYKKRLSFICDNPEQRILVELWPHAELTITDGAVHSAAAIDWHSARPFFVSDDIHLALRADVAAAIYITHLYHRGKSLTSPEVQRRVTFYSRLLLEHGAQQNADIVAVLESLFSPNSDLGSANVAAYSALLRIGVRVKLLRGSSLLHRAWRSMPRRVGAAFFPVPVIGPDGSGKTSIANALAEHESVFRLTFKHFYRGYHFRGFVKQQYIRTPPMCRGGTEEILMKSILALAILRWWPRTIARVMRWRIRGDVKSAIIVDRYFWDYLMRLSDQGARPSPMRGYRLFSKLIPTPQKAVVLCCGLKALYLRKKEMSPAAIDYLYDSYCDQIARKKVRRVLMLSTNGSFDRAYEQAAQFLALDRAPTSKWSLGPDRTSGKAQGQDFPGVGRPATNLQERRPGSVLHGEGA